MTATNVWKQPLNSNLLRAMKDSFSNFPENRLMISKAVPNNLHIKKPGQRYAAVLVPLCNRNQVPSLVFTLRTQTVGSHKGHVSFPGGHVDNGEDAVAAAVREMHEEVGLAPEHVQVLGIAQTLPAITGTLVTPVIGYITKDIEDLSLFTQSKGEVDEIFTRTVDELLQPGVRGTEMLSRLGMTIKMPYYGKKGDPQCVWGLTAMILEGVIRQLLIPSAEKCKTETVDRS
jgi:8-oxo-dGTP pyrophosphatase MutT (NUDIX family)